VVSQDFGYKHQAQHLQNPFVQRKSTDHFVGDCMRSKQLPNFLASARAVPACTMPE
jgi:hypothetical protein